jgi:hypothetical protein
MNSASKVLNLIVKTKRIPSINTGKMWMMKLGYYRLMQTKEKAQDWIWIIDHTIQMGKEKCLAILAIRAKDLPKTRALKYEDMEIIDLQPVETSTGEIVYQQLEENIKKTGVPRAIVSDMGSDIKNGVARFQEVHQESVHIYDLKHKMANLVKNILQSDEQWAEFKKFANFVVKKLQNTTLAGYRPPKQRQKARYMDIGNLVRWAENTLIKYESIHKKEEKTEDEIKLEIVLGDIAKFGEDIINWGEMVKVISLVLKFMNIHNLQTDSYEKFNELHGDRIKKLKTEKAKKLANELLSFIQEQQKVCRVGERLLHSSDILESLFGKLKFLEKEQSNSSFTSLILSVGAMVSKTTESIVTTALQTVSIPMIDKWCKEKIGLTIQAQKMELCRVANRE